MSKEKQIKSTDWLIRGIPKEQLEREKRAAIMSADLELCHTEFATGVGEIYTDYDATAQKLIAKGWSRQSEWISVDERLPEDNGYYLVYTKYGYIEVERFKLWDDDDCDGGYWWELEGSVTHWMPLPEAPKGGE